MISQRAVKSAVRRRLFLSRGLYAIWASTSRNAVLNRASCGSGYLIQFDVGYYFFCFSFRTPVTLSESAACTIPHKIFFFFVVPTLGNDLLLYIMRWFCHLTSVSFVCLSAELNRHCYSALHYTDQLNIYPLRYSSWVSWWPCVSLCRYSVRKHISETARPKVSKSSMRVWLGPLHYHALPAGCGRCNLSSNGSYGTATQ